MTNTKQTIPCVFQCYLFHMYVGVRAGGGIGDEIEDPAGDPYELYRILFDITFFFFVIVILLAIIQGTENSLAQLNSLYQQEHPAMCNLIPNALFIQNPNMAIMMNCFHQCSHKCFHLQTRFDHRRLRWVERPAGAGERRHGGERLWRRVLLNNTQLEMQLQDINCRLMSSRSVNTVLPSKHCWLFGCHDIATGSVKFGWGSV